MNPELFERLMKLKGLSIAMSEQVPSQAMAGTAAQIREEVDAILRDFGYQFVIAGSLQQNGVNKGPAT